MLFQSSQSISSRFAFILLQSLQSFSSRFCRLGYAYPLTSGTWQEVPTSRRALSQGGICQPSPRVLLRACSYMDDFDCSLIVSFHGLLTHRVKTSPSRCALSKGVCCIQVFAISHAVVVLFSIIYRQRSYSGGTMNHNHHLKHIVRSRVLLRHRVRFCSC